MLDRLSVSTSVKYEREKERRERGEREILHRVSGGEMS